MTLLRSIAYDRWITVFASVLLIVGAMAAQRGRSWGVALAFATACAFPVAFAIGIAPAWFCLVGLIGAWPFALSVRPFARFDKGATRLLAALAAIGGIGGAIAYKSVAWDLFTEFPSLRPSGDAQHGFALLATLAVVVAAIASRPRALGGGGGEEARVRIGERVRVSEGESSALEARETEDEHEHEHEYERERERATARRA